MARGKVSRGRKSSKNSGMKASTTSKKGKSGDRATQSRGRANTWSMARYEQILTNIDENGLYLELLITCKNMCFPLFKQTLLHKPLLQTRVEDGLLMLIEKERQGDNVDRTIVRNILRKFKKLKSYSDVFEQKFLAASERLYAAEGKRLVQGLDVPAYLQHVNVRLKEEQRLVLRSSTKEQLIHIVEKQLLTQHLNNILVKGLDDLLEENQIKDLGLLYVLFSRVENGVAQLCINFKLYIQKKGRKLVIKPKKDNMMVPNLLMFKEKMDKIVCYGFKKNNQFSNSLKEAFEHFINQRTNKPAEIIAKFVHSKLRSGNKKVNDKELNQIVVLFRFIRDRDIFEVTYRNYFAQRLLVDKSASVTAEKSMLSKLKQECGDGYTSKLEGMLADMVLSKNLNRGFSNHIHKVLKPEMIYLDLTVNILTTGCWPKFPVLDVHIPHCLLQFRDMFEVYYSRAHRGKNLRWIPALDSCVIEAAFPKGRKELQVSLLQALVLMIFNGNDELLFEDIQQITQIEDGLLRRTMQSLITPKARIFRKTPKGRNINETDKFHFNSNFTHKSYRIAINHIDLTETSQEKKSINHEVHQVRINQIDAAIVRIMKMRKTHTHNLLIKEVCAQLKFPAKAADLKKRIEYLIERDYIKRDKDNPKQYNYVA